MPLSRDTVTWSNAGGITTEEHGDYLQTMADHFFASVVKLVKQAVSTQSKLNSDEVGFNFSTFYINIAVKTQHTPAIRYRTVTDFGNLLAIA